MAAAAPEVVAAPEAAAAPETEAAAAPLNWKQRLWLYVLYVVGAMTVAAGIFALVYMVVHPSSYKSVSIDVGVEAASLARFALNRNNSLDYALALNLTLSNKSRIRVYHDNVRARALYGEEALGNTELPSFSQPKSNVTTVAARFQGQTQMSGGRGLAEKFDGERREGYHYVDVKVNMDVRVRRYDRRTFRTRNRVYRARVDCSLKIPMASVNGSMPGGFQRTECSVRV